MFIVKSREIVRGLVPTGRFRLTLESDVDGTAPEPLCGCQGGYASMADARKCPHAVTAALEALQRESFRVGIPEEAGAGNNPRLCPSHRPDTKVTS